MDSTDNTNANINSKQRHGCVTAWLTFMILANSFAALIYVFAGNTIIQNLPGRMSHTLLIVLSIFCIGNVLFSVMLLNWNKIGFWGYVMTTIGALIINLSIDLGIAQSLFGLLGIAILFAILQIEKNDVSAWNNLE